MADVIRVKLTGDRTQIARGLTVVNFAFTILEEPGQKAMSVGGNHSIAILKVKESDYDELFSSLSDIIQEAKDLQCITVEESVLRIQYFLGGDLKFLAVSCGIESASCDHACIWCKCPKADRYDMTKEWSIFDVEKGARTIEDISSRSKLGKRNAQRLNCARAPMFDFIPMHRVIIDSLHLFLKIADILINLLIRDIRILDGIHAKTCSDSDKSKARNLIAYESFVNEVCKVRFNFRIDKDTKKLNWRDLTGPEKVKLFSNISIPQLLPSLEKRTELQKLWANFYHLVKYLSKTECNSVYFDKEAKDWVNLFTSIYQTKDVTPYIHCFAMHISEFISLYGSIAMFTQQGLEKLNDLTTIYFQHFTNHHGQDALRQILEKRNHIEQMEIEGHQRVVRKQKCSRCHKTDHNKRTCPLKEPLQELTNT